MLESFKVYTDLVFWDYKRRDNAEFNFQIMLTLIKLSVDLDSCEKIYLYKPIFISAVGIIECILFDFLTRIQEHTNEKIVALNADDVKMIKNIELSKKLRSYVDLCKKYKLLGCSQDFYDDLIKLSVFRNRVHIQNDANHFPPDERNLWTLKIIQDSGVALEKILSHLAINYPRSINNVWPLFPCPWKELS